VARLGTAVALAREVEDHRADPGARAALAAGRAAQRGHPGALHQVLGLALLAHQPARDAHGPGLVAHQLLEGDRFVGHAGRA
jgi:hypothetical protein